MPETSAPITLSEESTNQVCEVIGKFLRHPNIVSLTIRRPSRFIASVGMVNLPGYEHPVLVSIMTRPTGRALATQLKKCDKFEAGDPAILRGLSTAIDGELNRSFNPHEAE